MKTSYQGNVEKTARAVGSNLPISTKVSYEIANAIRGKDAKKTVAYLENVTALKQAVPYKRYNSDVGHKPGKIASGRYPVKAATHFIKVLKNAIGNAVDKGLNDESLIIVHCSTSKGNAQWHHGRQRRRQMKASHIEILVQEVVAKKSTPKTETKAKAESKPVKETIKPKVETAKQSNPEEKTQAEPVKAEAKVEETKVEEVKAEEVKVESKETKIEGKEE